MKILHIVTLFTPDGAFGGPTRVAINQTRELSSSGHDVTLAGAALGFGRTLPTTVDGVPVRMFHAHRLVPRTGFAGLTSPGLLAWCRKATLTSDIIHIHLARDLVTLPAAMWADKSRSRYFLQPHGMVDKPSNALARLLDNLATRGTLERAAAVFCLNDHEQQEVRDLSRNHIHTRLLPNGVPESAPVARPAETEVLFMARMHVRKRPAAFLSAALRLRTEHPDVNFTLIGPDESEGRAITDALNRNGRPKRVQWEGALPPSLTLHRLRRCAIYVLPAINEPFPMSVLEAMSVGRPVVVTNTCGLAGFVEETGSGLVVDDSIDALTSAIRRLLDDEPLRTAMGANALTAVRARFSMTAIGQSLQDFYEDRPVSRSPEPMTR